MLSRVIDEPFRFDPEYYSKSNLMLEDLIKSTNGGAIESYNGKVDCSAFYPSITGFYSDDESLIPFIRVNEIQNGLVVLTDDTVFLPEKVLNDNQTTISKAYPGDLVIAKGGNTLAKVGLVTNEYPVYATCRDVIILRTNDLNGINKYYLWSFLHSKYGQNLMWRSASQTGQPHITLPIITNMHVPSLSEKFQLEVENLYIASVENKKLAEEKYKKAETKLLSELGVDICKFETEVFSVRRYTDILSAERMDAEYFQPKYDKLISTILKYDPKAKTLDDVAIYLFTGEYADKYMLFDKGLCHYVRGTDIYDGIVEIDLFHSVDPQKHSKFVCEGDIVTGRVGTIGNFGVISKELDNSVCSDNVLCFHLPNDYIPNVYALYFNSSIINELTNRMSRGSVQQRMNQETLRELIIPYIKYDTQIELNEIILCSFELMNKSKRLLECAKKAVEMAIEIDEFTAFQWLEESMRK